MNFGEASGEVQNFRAECGKLSGGHKSFRGECGKLSGGRKTFRAECGTFSGGRKTFRGECGKLSGGRKTFRAECGTFSGVPETSADCAAHFRESRKPARTVRLIFGSPGNQRGLCGKLAELSASSLKCAGRLRKFPQAFLNIF